MGLGTTLRSLFGFEPKPRMVPLGQRSFAFKTMDEAKGFMAHMSGWSGGGDTMMQFLQTTRYAAQFGGVMVRSTTGREVFTYGYAPNIYANDREYLLQRDPTAKMFVEMPWSVMWNGLPRSFIEPIDTYLAEMAARGLLLALQGSYQEYYQNGGALVYCETTTRSPSQRLQRGERPIRWHVIPAHRIVDKADGDDRYILATKRDPLVEHGIQSICVYLTEEDREDEKPTRLHGSRFFPVNLDPRAQGWWRTPRIPFNAIYDTLWEMRDLIFSRIRANFQGNPIVVDVDISADAQKVLNFDNVDDEELAKEAQAVEQGIVDFSTGGKQSFAPVMGYKLRRLGPADTPDAKEDVALLGARLAHGSLFSVKQVIASTKGNVDVGDQDILTFAGNVQNYRNTHGHGHLSRVVLMGRVMGANGLRMQDAHELPPATDLEWPLIRMLTPRDQSFVEKTEFAMAAGGWEKAIRVPARIDRKFPQDRSVPLAPWLAAKGRKRDGTSADPQPSSASGSSGGDDAAPGAAPAVPRRPPTSLPIPIPDEDAIADKVAERVTESLREDLEEVHALVASVASPKSQEP